MDLTDLVRRCLDDPAAEVAEQHATELSGFGALSTTSLRRVHGTTKDGRTWSFVAKSIQSPQRLPGLEKLGANFPWRADLDTYLEDLALPPGLRLPRLYAVEDLGLDRYVMWLEDVRTEAPTWDLPAYGTAARLLGELAALHPARGPSLGLRHYLDGPIAHLFLPALREQDLWRHPLIATHADPLLRGDLLALADRKDALVEAVDGLPHTLSHGDACPANLLVPADGSAGFVAIDWSWPWPTCVGFDLCQLLVGRAHTGELEAGELPAVHETIEAAYAAGSGFPAADVSLGYAATLVLVAAWTALPIERLGEEPTPELHELFRRRAGLARFIADLGRSL